MGKKYQCWRCSHPIGEELFDASMKAVCPNCYVTVQAVKAAEALFDLSPQDKAVLNTVAAVAVGVFLGKLLFG